MTEDLSPQFQRLDEEIKRLKQTFLGRLLEEQPYERLDYTPEEELQLSAFVVLCHAEIEEYIEERCLQILEEAKKIWSDTSRTAFAKILDPFLGLGKKYEDFRKTVGNNHGIGKHNLESIFSPLLGKDNVSKRFDNLWLEEMESLSKLRGGIAHKSRGQRTKEPLNPRDLEDRIEKIVYGRDRNGRLVYGGADDSPLGGLQSLDKIVLCDDGFWTRAK